MYICVLVGINVYVYIYTKRWRGRKKCMQVKGMNEWMSEC